MGSWVLSSDDKTNFNGQGYVACNQSVYATGHDQASADSLTNYNQYHPIGQRYNISALAKYQIFRTVMRFDLSSVPAGTSILRAVMTILRGSGFPTQYRDWDIVLVDGSDCTDPIVNADYGDLLDDTTSLGSVAISETTVSTTFNITLNATGRSFLESKIGSVAVIAIRSSEDISSTVPPDYNAGEYTETNFSLIHATDYPYITIISAFPTDAITRVTGLIHRYVRATGEYTLTMSLGEVADDFGLPDVHLRPARATAEVQEEQETDAVVEKVKTKLPRVQPPRLTIGAAPEPTKFQRQAAERITEPAPVTARTIRITQEREQEFQRLETRIAQTRMATPIVIPFGRDVAGAPAPVTERTRRIIRESPQAQQRLADIEQERKKWWEFWK